MHNFLVFWTRYSVTLFESFKISEMALVPLNSCCSGKNATTLETIKPLATADLCVQERTKPMSDRMIENIPISTTEHEILSYSFNTVTATTGCKILVSRTGKRKLDDTSLINLTEEISMGTYAVKYTPTIGPLDFIFDTRCHSITCMKEYENKSFEELRYEDYKWAAPERVEFRNVANAPPIASNVPEVIFSDRNTQRNYQSNLLFEKNTRNVELIKPGFCFGGFSTFNEPDCIFCGKPVRFEKSTRNVQLIEPGFSFGRFNTFNEPDNIFRAKPVGFDITNGNASNLRNTDIKSNQLNCLDTTMMPCRTTEFGSVNLKTPATISMNDFASNNITGFSAGYLPGTGFSFGAKPVGFDNTNGNATKLRNTDIKSNQLNCLDTTMLPCSTTEFGTINLKTPATISMNDLASNNITGLSAGYLPGTGFGFGVKPVGFDITNGNPSKLRNTDIKSNQPNCLDTTMMPCRTTEFGSVSLKTPATISVNDLASNNITGLSASYLPGTGFSFGAKPGFSFGAKPGFSFGAKPGFSFGAKPGFGFCAKPVGFDITNDKVSKLRNTDIKSNQLNCLDTTMLSCRATDFGSVNLRTPATISMNDFSSNNITGLSAGYLPGTGFGFGAKTVGVDITNGNASKLRNTDIKNNNFNCLDTAMMPCRTTEFGSIDLKIPAIISMNNLTSHNITGLSSQMSTLNYENNRSVNVNSENKDSHNATILFKQSSITDLTAKTPNHLQAGTKFPFDAFENEGQRKKRKRE